MSEKAVIIIIAVAAGMLFLLMAIMAAGIGRQKRKIERLLKNTWELHIDINRDIRELVDLTQCIEGFADEINEKLSYVGTDFATAVQIFAEMIRQAMGVEGQHEENNNTLQE